MINTVFALSEKSQNVLKVIIIILLILVIVLTLLGLLGMLIEKIMKKQGRKVDEYMNHLIFSRMVDKKKDFEKYAKLKNRILFFKQSIPPVIFGVAAVLIWVIYHLAFNPNWSESIFTGDLWYDGVNQRVGTGIMTLFYTFDFTKVEYVPPLGFTFDKIIVTNTPHFVGWPTFINYIVFIFGAIAIIWYLVNVQAYVSRLFRISELSKKLYSKDLDSIDLSYFYDQQKLNPHAKKEEPNESSLDNSGNQQN